MSTQKQVIVMGGGASGMVAAMAAAYEGAAVTILEHNTTFGRKLLATGNGKCNLTNQNMSVDKFRGSDSNFIATVLQEYSMFDTLKFFQKIGIYTRNKNGYLYPYCEQAVSVLDNFLMELKRLSVKMKTNEHVLTISKGNTKWTVGTNTWNYTADSVVLATGSGASTIAGADFEGLQIARQLGHTVKEPLPALVPLAGCDAYYGKWAGVRIQANVSLQIDGEFYTSERGEVQLTKYGVSGIPVMMLSRYAVLALHEHKKVVLMMDFMPDFSQQELTSFMNQRTQSAPQKSTSELLVGLLPEKLIPVLLENLGNESLVHRIKNFPVSIKKDRGFQEAQVAQGGVQTAQINPFTMESQLQKGLYFAGEVLDVDGTCGGYNLQWAWSTGWIAGTHAGKD